MTINTLFIIVTINTIIILLLLLILILLLSLLLVALGVSFSILIFLPFINRWQNAELVLKKPYFFAKQSVNYSANACKNKVIKISSIKNVFCMHLIPNG